MSDRDPDIGPGKPDWATTRALSAADILRRMVAHAEGGTTDLADAPMPLPKGAYTDPDRFEAERTKLFLGQPIVAGLTGDVPQPGDMMVFDAAGPSILVSRGKDNVVRAFLNMCTHRGAKLVEEAEPFAGHKARMTCPFHAWTFDSKGTLIGQPSKKSFAGCDISARNLIELPCVEHLGLIFVRAGGGEPIDIDTHLGEFADVLAMLELQRAVPVKKGILTAESNWKFALDTYGEGYHFATLHASTIGQTHYNDMAVFYPFGRHHRLGFPDKSVGENVGKPEAEWAPSEYGGVHFLFPNTVIFFGAVVPGVYFTQLFRLFPDGMGKTRCQFAVYAPFGITSEEYRNTCVTAYDMTAQVVQTEDYRIASAGYENLLHAPDDFRTVLGANEIAVQMVQRHVADAIGMPL
jgi:phenylpropionate dioxygenase-like ring-hydroxylating dioxygenase large terminal subunit